MFQTKAQRSAERWGTFYLACIIAICNAGMVFPFLPRSELSLGITAFAPMLVWAWNLWFFGPKKLRCAMIFMFRSADKSVYESSQKAAQQFLAGHIVSQGWGPKGRWKGNIQSKMVDHAIVVEANVRSADLINSTTSGGAVNVDALARDLDEKACAALMVLLTEDGDPYRLNMMQPMSLEFDFSDFTGHEKIAAAQFHRKALERLEEELV